MRRAELEYDLPRELIAQEPREPRDASRLLVLERSTGTIRHRGFRELVELLLPGDCLVLNDTRVLPARFYGRRSSGGHVEGLFLHAEASGWRVLLKPSGRLKVGERLECSVASPPTAHSNSDRFTGLVSDAVPGLEAAVRADEDARHGGLTLRSGEPQTGLTLLARGERGEWLVRPEPAELPAAEWLARVGHTPLPPYIRGGREGPTDAARYQTVYAARPGAVAAPTAGLHFTPELLAALEACGVRRASVTLHVGAGTFLPIEVDDLAEHPMHAEWYEVAPAAVESLRVTRATGGRIVAVGTTAVRVLESLPSLEQHAAASGWTRIFIYPPYQYRHVDSLITNFHLPGSTLLALVMALASPEQVRAAYAAAIGERYRFYSYGDAMLVL